jgi:hypothetical protein
MLKSAFNTSSNVFPNLIASPNKMRARKETGKSRLFEALVTDLNI